MSGETKDLLGLAPHGEALHTLTKGAVDGAAAFLGRICLPAAAELGELFRDRVRHWRASNAVRIAQSAEKKLLSRPDATELHAHPRIVGAVFEHGSWSDDSQVQEMWAGLLASACTPDGKDEENYLFLNLLQQLTSSEAKVLSFACASAPKSTTHQGLIWGEYFAPPVSKVMAISGVSDIHRLDRELDHLRALELVNGGFDVYSVQTEDPQVRLTPTPLGLSLYVRCQGSSEPPVIFFGLTASKPSPG